MFSLKWSGTFFQLYCLLFIDIIHLLYSPNFLDRINSSDLTLRYLQLTNMLVFKFSKMTPNVISSFDISSKF